MTGSDRTEETEQNPKKEQEEPEESNRFWVYARWIGGFLIISVLVFLFVYFDLRTKFQTYFDGTIQPWIDAHPITGPLVYGVVYILAVVAFLPGSIVTLAGGALFGPIWGTIIVSICSTTGAAFAFLVARYLGKSWIEEKAGDRLDRLQEGIKNNGWQFVAFTRLVPIFPFNLLNYMYGLTRISFWRYTLVSWVAMLPGTFAYVYAGYAAKVAAAGGKGVKKTLLIISIALGVLILVSLIPKFLKKKAPEELEVEDS